MKERKKLVRDISAQNVAITFYCGGKVPFVKDIFESGGFKIVLFIFLLVFHLVSNSSCLDDDNE